MTTYQRTPISYYGGKQQMLRHILPLIPKHKTYIEPFFGGGAVFWAKQPAQVEIINDLNAHVINFYKVLKTRFNDLSTLIQATLHSRDLYKEALIIYHAPMLFDEVRRAWAFWLTTNSGYARKIGTWGYDRGSASCKALDNKRKEFTLAYCDRLANVQIESNDAIKVIRSRDVPDAFIYCDPPYVGSDQGHYGGYTQEHFTSLLDTLAAAKGRFLLSSYPNEQLQQHARVHGWHTRCIDMHLSASKSGRRKTEVLTANYELRE